MPDWSITRLADSHDRTGFDSGQPLLDRFLRELAGQYDRRGLARTFALTAGAGPAVLGYYTLSASGLPFASVPDRVKKRLPQLPLPAILLGRTPAGPARGAT